MLDLGVTEGALVLLVLDRVINVIRVARNGHAPSGNGATNAKLDRLIAQSERQITLLQGIRSNGKS